MKKTGLFKIIMFILLGLIVATWLFSASYYTNGAIQDLDMYNIGFFDFWQLLFGTFEFQYFIQIFILLLSVGVLYEVLGKTGKYRAWIEKIVKKFKGNELMFILCTAFIIALLSSVFDYGFALFIFFPFIISILLAMGYDRFTVLIATFGSVLIGTIGNTTGYNTSGVINNLLDAKLNNGIYFKLALLVFALAIEFFVLYKAKRNKVTEKAMDEDMFIGEKSSNKYSVVGLIVVFSLLFVMLVLGCTSWENTFGVTIFSAAKEAVTGFTVKLPYFHFTAEGLDYGSKEIAIFGRLLGTVSAFGEWYYAEMSVMCLLAAIVIGLCYRIKDLFEVMADGAKKMLRPAFLVMMIYTVIYFAGNTMFYPTIGELLLHITSKFNIFFATISMILASAIHVDMLYVANYAIPQIAGLDVAKETVAVLGQGIYGATMFVAPTSAMLALGLSYLGLSYKDWVKNYWKFILALFVLVVVVCVITLFVY